MRLFNFYSSANKNHTAWLTLWVRSGFSPVSPVNQFQSTWLSIRFLFNTDYSASQNTFLYRLKEAVSASLLTPSLPIQIKESWFYTLAVNPKGNQPNIHWKDWCWSWNSNILATWWEELTHWKKPWCWGNWGEEKGATENEVVGWHHQLNGHTFKQTLGDREGQGNTACCSSWSHRVGRDWATQQQQQNIPLILFYLKLTAYLSI